MLCNSNLTKIGHLQDIRQTPEYAKFMSKIGWHVKYLGLSSVFVKKIPFLPFSIIKALRYQKLDQLQLGKLIKKHHAIIIKKEPFIVEKYQGGQIYFQVCPANKWPLVPTKTLWLNLSLTENRLLGMMRPKTRYNLKKSQKNNLAVRVIGGGKITQKQLTTFYKIWSSNKPHNWLFKPSISQLKSLIEAFSHKCFLVLTSNYHSTLDPLLAGCLILTSKNMAFYWHNASTLQGKKLYAPTLCIWEAIKESKRRGLKLFDFEGVWDERLPQLNQGFKGFTQFKSGFSS